MLKSNEKILRDLCERAYSICMGDCEASDKDDWITDYNWFRQVREGTVKTASQKLVGRFAIFKYPNYGYPDSHPDYTAHSGQRVKILRVMEPPEIDPEISHGVFSVQADDGWTGTANRDELRILR